MRKRIDFDQGFIQAPVIVIITLCGLCIWIMIKYAFIDRLLTILDSELPFPWITTGFLVLACVVLIVLPIVKDGEDGNILNGFIMTAYITLLTTQALLQIHTI